jgi:glycosyltransferase involved in cell wall biosynthesis
MKTTVKIFVDENEFDFVPVTQQKISAFTLNSETSVLKLKAHFFETLRSLGEIVKFKRTDITHESDFARALKENDCLVATFHEPPPELPCRLLQHTKGALMLPGGFLDKWTFEHPATVSLVTTNFQASCIKQAFPKLSLNILPFYPMIDSDFLEENAAIDYKQAEQPLTRHMLYAGRWIANKGLVQTVRSLSLWPSGVDSFEMVGQFEKDFPASECGGNHFNYPFFHRRECVSQNSQLKLVETASLPTKALVSSYRSAFGFAYLSFHEDENYGMAPREAAACGAIPLVTDWCGLGEFGRNAIGGLVCTWPTLGGVRYSLKDAANESARIMNWTDSQRKRASSFNRELVASECSGLDSARQMSSAVTTLLKLPVAAAPEGGWRCPFRLERLISQGPPSFQKVKHDITMSKREGLYVEGLGFACIDYSEVDLLTTIQALYTTWPCAPRLKPGIRLHGFWRVTPWQQERALVEFGFPGPRILRFTESDWRIVVAGTIRHKAGNFSFEITNTSAVKVFQHAVDLGYLVPDDPVQCDLPVSNHSMINKSNPCN